MKDREIRARNGRTVQTPYTDEDAFNRLCALVASGDLAGDFPTRLTEADRLTEEMVKWIHILVVEHEQAPEPQSWISPPSPRSSKPAAET